jgi:hypothetical protein
MLSEIRPDFNVSCLESHIIFYPCLSQIALIMHTVKEIGYHLTQIMGISELHEGGRAGAQTRNQEKAHA